MRLEHAVKDGIMTIYARCDAACDGDSSVSVVPVLLRFLVRAAEVIASEKAVFELSRPQAGAMINLDVTVLVRAADEPPSVDWQRIVRGADM